MTSGAAVRIAILLAVLAPSAAVALYVLRVPPEPTPTASGPQDAAEPERRPPSAAPRPLAVQRQVEAWNRLIAANFAGDAACAECHVDQYEAHRRSGHSHTATPMAQSELAAQLLSAGTYTDPLRQQRFAFDQQGDQFTVREIGNEKLPAVSVTWLLGSGTHAQTPIAVDERTQSGVEFRWSYLAHTGALGVTPDQQRFGDYREGTVECYGRPMDSADIRACLGCHSTLTPPPQLPIRNQLVVPNVGCERCHGPRKKHVVMAHQGRAAEAQPLVQYETPESYLDACSQCHRDEGSVNPDAAPHELVRFQPYGLKRSRCYSESSTMTCSTCHDPHDAVSQDRDRYVQQCQQCHQPETPQQCAQQPTGDCIECHMPAVEWTAGIAFHDHWIRVPSRSSTESAARSD